MTALAHSVSLKSIAAVIGGGSFSPRSLFSAGEQGAWYDPSDFSTMFQDSAGTTPVTAVEQPVGLIRDKSGRGNHASQATSTSRPVLSARVNLALNSGFSGAVAGTPGTAPTNWAFVLSGGTTNSVVSDGNGGFVVSYSATAARQIVNQTVAVSVATYSAKLKIDAHTGGLKVNNIFILSSVPAGTTTNFYANGTLIDATTYTPVAGDILEARSIVTTAGNIVYRIGVGTSGVSTGTLAFSMFDVRLFNQVGVLPPYQRVTTSTDYDTTGFPYYLAFDGTDDFLVTGTIDPGSVDKAQVFAGVRKLSDALDGRVVQHGDPSSSNNGSFVIDAPGSGAVTKYQFASRGTVTAVPFTTSTAFNAPNTSVVTGLGNIAGDTATLRANGTQIAQVTTDQGTGNYLSYPLYIGSRLGSLRFNGNIYSLIVRFGSNLDATTISSTETWVNSKTKAY